MNIQIISVGSKPRPAVNDLITTYETRLPRSVQVSWCFIKHGNGDAKTSMKHEAERILRAIPQASKVILLDETGIQIKSEEFSEKFIKPNQNICFVIGGSYGVDESVKNVANTTMSLSKLVFPHQLVRIILIEQIYRAQSIASGHPYHHS